MKVKIKHVDGKTDVMAKVLPITGEEVNLEYKFENMTYGKTISIDEAVKMKIIKNKK